VTSLYHKKNLASQQHPSQNSSIHFAWGKLGHLANLHGSTKQLNAVLPQQHTLNDLSQIAVPGHVPLSQCTVVISPIPLQGYE